MRERVEAPGGPVVAVLEIAGMPFGVATESAELGTPSPESAGVTTVRVSLHVDDPDAAAARAIAAGATEMFPVETSRTDCARAGSSTRSGITG
jgi:PhnB protein